MWREIDTRLFLLFNSTLTSSFTDVVMPVVTDGRFWIIPGLCACAFLIKREGRRSWYFVVLAIAAVAITDPLVSRLLKPLVGKLRPCHPDVLLEGAHFLLGHKRSYSFPSAHAANSFAQASLFTLLYPRLAYLLMPLAALVAFSRVYVGVHYPLDITVGAMLGTLVGILVYQVGKAHIPVYRAEEDHVTNS